MTFADSNGVRIHYVDHGGDGPRLLLVHPTGFHAHVWDPFVPALRDRFRVVAIDTRGHGDSDVPEGDYDWRRFGADVLAVVDATGAERPLGMGHSSGSASLIHAEASRPGTFARLALLDPVTPPPSFRTRAFPADQNPMSIQARRRRAVWDSPAQMVERLRAGTPMASWREDFLRAYAEHGLRRRTDGRYELKCPPAIEASVYERAGEQDGWEKLWALGCPYLLVLGERSELWGDRSHVPEDLAGRVRVLPDAGHFFPMERPDETLEIVLPFLAGYEQS